MKIYLLIFIISVSLAGCSRHSQNTLATADNSEKQLSTDKVNFHKDLLIEDVKFDYDKNVFSDIKSSVVPASPLQSATDKPGFLQSRYINFQLSYKNIKKSPAEFSVFKVSEFKKAYFLEPHYVQIIEKSLAELRKTINRTDKISPSISEELPLVPLYDAEQAFHAKAKTINFQNGKGLIFLTQITHEATIIHNEDLEYIFQGLTEDDRYFIYAQFPVSAEGLPASYTDTFEDYNIQMYYDGNDIEKRVKAHEKYLNKIALRLDNFKDEQFKPKLSKIESLLSSIKIK